jgi:hypothetical protein
MSQFHVCSIHGMLSIAHCDLCWEILELLEQSMASVPAKLVKKNNNNNNKGLFTPIRTKCYNTHNDTILWCCSANKNLHLTSETLMIVHYT